MNLTDRAIQDAKKITSNNNDWGVSAVFVSPTLVTATVNVLHIKHNTGFDLDGMKVNSKISSIAVSESLLNDNNYITRDVQNEATLKGHLVSVKDSTGIVKQYRISENFPDEKLGLITLILEDFE